MEYPLHAYEGEPTVLPLHDLFLYYLGVHLPGIHKRPKLTSGILFGLDIRYLIATN